MGFNLGARQAKGFFFDQQAVLDMVDAKERQALSKMGAFVRRSARSSIRKRKAVSAPGSPPTNRTGTLRDYIFFSFDPASRSVVVGPVKLPSKDGDQPRTLEFGGNGRAARPYMGPALQREQSRFQGLFAAKFGGG